MCVENRFDKDNPKFKFKLTKGISSISVCIFRLLILVNKRNADSRAKLLAKNGLELF